MRMSTRILTVVAGLAGATLLMGPGTAYGADELAPAATAVGREQVRDTFPHSRHEGLFPLCTGCHEGVPGGDEASFYPDPAFCDRCHASVGVEGVEWTPPEPGRLVNNLSFAHDVHGQAVSAEGDDALECATCHRAPGEEGQRMAVDPLDADRCLSCHGHPADNHTVDAECGRCHVPMASSGLPVERISAIRRPRDHFTSAFLSSTHGDAVVEQMSRCATCHTRERCEACHVDAGDRSQIQSFPAAEPGMELPQARSRYPTPESHSSADFEREHGTLSDEVSCATCHTQDDCASCHLAPLPEAAQALHARGSVRAPGVGLEADTPESHQSAFFLDDHPTLAAPDPAQCTSCHTEAFCVECHEGPRLPEYHPPDFVARHPAEAWNQTAECSTCHEAQAFCRSCHVSSGFSANGKLGPGYHDAEPVWVLRHGQAARQSLESCASCHSQRNCLQCHSTVGSFQIDPHGRDFDAERAWDKNPGICLVCHVTKPVGGGGS